MCVDGPLHRLPVPPQNLVALVPEHHQVVVFQEDHPPGIGQDGRDVRGQEIFALPQAQDQGAFLAGRHQHPRLLGIDDAQGVGAPDGRQSLAHRLQILQPLAQILGDEMGDDLGVGLRRELVALLKELLLHLQVVFDDAVMDHGDGVHQVGMGVGLGGAAVGGPAGVADAHLARQGLPAQQLVQFDQFAHAAANGQAVIADHRHPRRIIAPILQAFQAVQNDGHGLLGPQITDNAAHIYLF